MDKVFRLPELLELIISHLSEPSDVASCARVNRNFNEMALARLWRGVADEGHHETSYHYRRWRTPSACDLYQCCHGMESLEKNLKYIVNFDLQTGFGRFDPILDLDLQRLAVLAYQRVFDEFEPASLKIEHITIVREQAIETENIEKILKPALGRRLKSLMIRGLNHHRFDASTLFSTLEQSCPNLSRFIVDENCTFALAEQALPRFVQNTKQLTKLALWNERQPITGETLQMILLHRKLEHVVLSANVILSNTMAEDIVATMPRPYQSRLRVLELTGTPVSAIQKILPHLSTVSKLSVSEIEDIRSLLEWILSRRAQHNPVEFMAMSVNTATEFEMATLWAEMRSNQDEDILYSQA